MRTKITLASILITMLLIVTGGSIALLLQEPKPVPEVSPPISQPTVIKVPVLVSEPYEVVETRWLTVYTRDEQYVAEKLAALMKGHMEQQEREYIRKLRDFKDTDELEAFLAKDDTDNVILMSWDGSITGQCEDYAIKLRDNAADKGFNIEVTKITPSQFSRYYPHYRDLPSNEEHALNLTIIGNDWIYIEPTTDEWWVAGHLD